MKKFFFTLENVLQFKEQMLDNLKGEHAGLLAKVRKCEMELEALEKEHRDCAREFSRHKAEGMQISDIYTYERYLEALGLKIRDKQDELATWRRREEEKRNEVVEAKKDTSSIEKLKDKRLLEYEKQVQKQEELFIEEYVATQSAMAKLNG